MAEFTAAAEGWAEDRGPAELALQFSERENLTECIVLLMPLLEVPPLTNTAKWASSIDYNDFVWNLKESRLVKIKLQVSEMLSQLLGGSYK